MPRSYRLDSSKIDGASWAAVNYRLIKFTLDNLDNSPMYIQSVSFCIARGQGYIRSGDTSTSSGSYRTYTGNETAVAGISLNTSMSPQIGSSVNITQNITVEASEGGVGNSGYFKALEDQPGGPEKYLVVVNFSRGEFTVPANSTEIFYAGHVSGSGALSVRRAENCPVTLEYYLKEGSPPISGTLTASPNPTLVGNSVSRNSLSGVTGYQIRTKSGNTWSSWSNYSSPTFTNSSDNNIIAVQFRAYKTDEDYEISTSYKESDIVYFKLNTPTLTISPETISIGESVNATASTNDSPSIEGIQFQYRFWNQGDNIPVTSYGTPSSSGSHTRQLTPRQTWTPGTNEVDVGVQSTYYNSRSGGGFTSDRTSRVEINVRYRPRDYDGSVSFKSGGQEITEGFIVIPTNKFSLSWDAFPINKHLGNFNVFQMTLQDISDPSNPRDVYTYIGDNDPSSSGQYNDTVSLLDKISSKTLVPGRNHRLVFSLQYRYLETAVNDVPDQVNSNIFYSPTFIVAGFPDKPSFLYPIDSEEVSNITINQNPQVIVKCKNPSYLTEDISRITRVEVRMLGRTSGGVVSPLNFFASIIYDDEGLPSFDGEDLPFISVKKVQGTEIVLVIEAGYISLFKDQEYFVTVTCVNSFDLSSSEAVSLTYKEFDNVQKGQIITAKKASDLGNLCLSYLNSYQLLTKEFVENHPTEGRPRNTIRGKPSSEYTESYFKDNIIKSRQDLWLGDLPLGNWLDWFLYVSNLETSLVIDLYHIVKSYGVRRSPSDEVVRSYMTGKNSKGHIIYAETPYNLQDENSPYYEGNIFNTIIDILKYML